MAPPVRVVKLERRPNVSIHVKYIGIGDYDVIRKGEAIATLALGSCIAVILVDRDGRYAGMLHAMLPEPRPNQVVDRRNLGKFVATGVPALLDKLRRRGVLERRLYAYLVGGANVIGNLTMFNIGQRNVDKAKEVLTKKGIEIKYMDVGGESSRNVLLDLTNPTLYIWSSVRKRFSLSLKKK